MKIKVNFSVILRIRREGDTYGLIVCDNQLTPPELSLHFHSELGDWIQRALHVDKSELYVDGGRRVASSFWVDPNLLPGLRIVFAGWVRQWNPLSEMQRALAENFNLSRKQLDLVSYTRPYRYIYDYPVEPLQEPYPELWMSVVYGLRPTPSLRGWFDPSSYTDWVGQREIREGWASSGMAISQVARFVLDYRN